MENNDLGFMNIQLFAEPEGATTPTTDTTSQVDYEAEYKKMVAERDSYKSEVEKQKQIKDKYASENAEYKKKEIAKMSDDEKKAKELQDLIDSKNQMEAEIRMMKLERDLLSNGFSAEESEKLISANISISDVKILTEIIKNKVDVAVKSAKAEAIKENTPTAPMGNGTANDCGQTAFQKFQAEKNKNKTKKEIKFN